MDRKDLIRLYLDAETTCEQEQELAASFATTPPADEEEMAVYKMMQAVKPIELPELPEAGDEYDRMVRPSRVRPFYTWGLSLAGPVLLLPLLPWSCLRASLNNSACRLRLRMTTLS